MVLDFRCCGHVSHRVSFRGFELVDVVHTRKAYHALDGFDQGILRKYLHGPNITNEHAQHWSHNGSDRCQLCGGLDSSYHRLRDALPSDSHQALPTLPTVVSLHVWTLHSSLHVPWLQHLGGLPRSFPIPSVPPPVRSWTFSRMAAVCIPEIPNVGLPRLLVHAAPVQLDYDPSGFKPLIAQPLAGVLESAYRTELQAIVVAPVGGRSVWGLGSHLVR